METHLTEVTATEAEGLPLNSIRWAAIFAGLAVGLGITLLLMLIGMATGLAVYGSGARPDGSSVSIAAGLWNTISMFIAALVGGFVAARASGLRRSMDGMLHGVVSWGATMLVFAILTGTLTGSALSGAFGLASQTAQNQSTKGTADLLATIERGDRTAAVDMLRNRFGLTQEQASSAADRALAMTGRSNTEGSSANTPTTDDKASDVAYTASVASAWLSLIVLVSLLAGAGGGLLGARSVRQRSQPGHYAEQRFVRSHSTPSGRIPTAG